jgi:hypothetical protein
VISGTPTSSHVGYTYDLTVGGQNRSIKVYAAQTVAPVSSFTVAQSVDLMSVTLTFTGSNASVVFYDYGDGSPKTTSTTHSYDEPGAFVIRAIAVNNLGERTSAALVYTGGYSDPTPSTRPLNLTNVTYKQGEMVWIPLTIYDGETVSLTGGATLFCVLVDDVITGDTANTPLGNYALTVTLITVDGETVQKTITVSIISPGGAEDEEKGLGTYSTYIIGVIVLLVILYIVYRIITREKKPKKPKKAKPKRGRGKK